MNKVLKSVFADSSILAKPLVIDPNMQIYGSDRAECNAKDIVTRAKRQAETALSNARDNARSVLAQAYADGYQAGIDQAATQSEEMLKKLEQAINDESAEREALVEVLEEQALMLCIEVAEKIIRHEIKTDPSVVARAIKSCLRRIRDRDEVTVRVNPSEVAHIRAMREELIASSDGVRGVNVIDDRRVSAGGCIVECLSGDYDAKIETQIDLLRRKLTDMFNNEYSKSS